MFGRIPWKWGKTIFGRLHNMFTESELQYPPGISCILDSGDEDGLIDMARYESATSVPVGGGGTAKATGDLKTVIGIFYSGFYTGPVPGIGGVPPWTESDIREQFTNDIEESIYNFSNGNTSLVGMNGTGPVTILGPIYLQNTVPNSFSNYSDPCNQFASNGAIGQAYAALAAFCPNCDVRTALILACPNGSLQPPGNHLSLRGFGGDPTLSVTRTDGMVGYNQVPGQDCSKAPGTTAGGYIPEEDINIVNGRVKLVILHEIMHTMGWPHTSKPYESGSWCPPVQEGSGPMKPCTDSTQNYRGLDNLGAMSFGGYCGNPYNIFDAHPNAATKYIRGLGLTTADDGIWLPSDAVEAFDLSPGQSKNVRLYAHDTSLAEKEAISAGTVGTPRPPITYLIRIKRPVDLSQRASGDTFPVDDRDLFVSYRKKAWYRKKDEWSSTGGTNSTWSQGGYTEGSVHLDWGPVAIGSKSGVLTLAKLDAADLSTSKTYTSYSANGNSYPAIKVSIIEHRGIPGGEIGPDSIIVRVEAI